MEVEKMVQLFNEGKKTLKEIGVTFGVSKSTVQRRIVGAGYILDKKNNIYVKQLNNVSHETVENTKQSNNVSHETVENTKQSNNVSHETSHEIIENEKMVNGSYTISVSLQRALKFKAVSEDKKVIDLVREALEKLIEPKYFNM